MHMGWRSAVTVTRTCGVRFVLAALTVSGCVAGMGGAAYADTLPPTINPLIVGGKPANVPWVMEAYGDEFICSAVQLNPDWVMTAAHCRPPSGVWPSDGKGGVSGSVSVDKVIYAPNSDVELMHLSTPHPLAVYPEIDLGYVPRDGDTGPAYGYGEPYPDRLRVAMSRVLVYDNDTPAAIHVVGVDGAGQDGDSGGPLMINGKLVGVLSGGTISGGIHEHNWYANLAGAKDFVSSALIGPLSLDSGGISVALGREYFNSKQRIMIWVNGNYVGETYNGAPYYASATPTNSGVTLRLGTHLNPGDYVQVGIVPGVPGNTPPSPSTARLFAQQAFDTVRSVTRTGDQVNVVLSNWLVASSQHVIVWINGKYAAHTASGSVYYGVVSKSGDSVTIRLGAVNDGDEVVVGIDLTPTNSVPSPSAPNVRVLAKTVL